MASEDHDSLIRLEVQFADLRSDVSDMRGEMRDNHGTLSASVQTIRDILARTGLNGLNGPPRGTDGFTLNLSRRTLWIVSVAIMGVLTGAVGLKVDWGTVGQAANALSTLNSASKIVTQ